MHHCWAIPGSKFHTGAYFEIDMPTIALLVCKFDHYLCTKNSACPVWMNTLQLNQMFKNPIMLLPFSSPSTICLILFCLGEDDEPTGRIWSGKKMLFLHYHVDKDTPGLDLSGMYGSFCNLCSLKTNSYLWLLKCLSYLHSIFCFSALFYLPCHWEGLSCWSVVHSYVGLQYLYAVP